MKKTLCSLLVLSVMSTTIPAYAADADAANAAAVPVSKPIAAAASKAGADLSSRVRPLASAQKVPTNLPRSGSDRVRKQGGGKTGMIIGLVSSVVGAAATVYMVREMKKDTDSNN